MTADQFFGLTQRRLDQLHWPGYKGEGIKEVRMTVGQLQVIKKTLQDIEANRQGQNGPNLDQEDNKEEQERKATKSANGCNKPVIIKNKTQINVLNGYVSGDSNSKGRAEHETNKLKTNIKGKKKERENIKQSREEMKKKEDRRTGDHSKKKEELEKEEQGGEQARPIKNFVYP